MSSDGKMASSQFWSLLYPPQSSLWEREGRRSKKRNFLCLASSQNEQEVEEEREFLFVSNLFFPRLPSHYIFATHLLSPHTPVLIWEMKAASTVAFFTLFSLFLKTFLKLEGNIKCMLYISEFLLTKFRKIGQMAFIKPVFRLSDFLRFSQDKV